ncbi:hypothetical protein C0Q70_08782 [Pomacea canaliculata]|uniref:Short-chain collagen C4-like n=1 Tax=Pomacea canaliculata TaxID=400727 RepID=A0A2T7P7Z4_POMCA|nr:uncharacterized protein LOC112564369 [Pomacea canaliculata]PVD29531.1 hypothetical protein C0Q70_08782 [Pomacea canaliculata]
MKFSAIFLLTAVTGCVSAAADQQMLQDEIYSALITRIEGLVNRVGGLEDMVRTQAQLLDNMVAERQDWLAEKQSLQTSFEHLRTVCSASKVISSDDKTENEKKAVGQTPETAREGVDNQKFVRSDDSDPLVPIVTQLSQKVSEMSAELQVTKTGLTEASTSVFVNWGSSTCPDSAVLVYSGEVGGSHYTSLGAAANYLCLPLSGVNLVDSSNSNNAGLYGSEFESQDSHQDKDVVCAVCRSSRANNVMIPATTVCPAGWTSEYSGWLMAGYPAHNAASEFICVNSKMEERLASETDNNGKLLYYTVTVCGSLPCPPYVTGKRVTCVVCSK